MKNFILLIAVLVVGACVSMPTMKSVSGTYENKDDRYPIQWVLLENGIFDSYINDKRTGAGKWKISEEGEVHIAHQKQGDPALLQLFENNEAILIVRINKDASITAIAVTDKDEKRLDAPKDEQFTVKKIK